MVFVIGLAAALFLGLGYVLQQRMAARSRESSAHAIRLLFELMHYKLWWAGIGAMIAGQVLGGLALQIASVAVVGPLLSASLLFAFIISAFLSKHPVLWHEVLGALLVMAALGVFLAIGNPRFSDRLHTRWPELVLAVCILGGVVAVVTLTGARRGLVGQSVLLATAAGLLYGLQDVATRASFLVIGNHGVTAALGYVWPYLVIGAAAVGIVISQSAFKAARLDYSLPPIAAAEPVVGIALGVVLLGDRLSASPGALVAEAACLVAMVLGVIFIGGSKSLAGHGVHAPAPRPEPTAALASGRRWLASGCRWVASAGRACAGSLRLRRPRSIDTG